MAMNFTHPSYASRTQEPQPPSPATSRPGCVLNPSYLRALARADRACCCLALPAVMAIMPAAPGRPHRTELLLCMHHYRAARHQLARAGAIVLDGHGRVLTESDTWALPALA